MQKHWIESFCDVTGTISSHWLALSMQPAKRRWQKMTLTPSSRAQQLNYVPRRVLDTLVSHHTLVRSGGVIEFHHQQIQEWFASHAVEELIRQSAGGNLKARNRLVSSILNLPAWEESILFAIERLSRLPDGAGLAAYGSM